LIFVVNSLLPSGLNGFPDDGKLNTSVNLLWNNDTANDYLNQRIEVPEFNRRPFMYSAQFLFQKIDLPSQASFTLLNFTFYFAFLYLLMSHLEVSNFESYAKLAFFISFCFSNLFAFAATICTYDDYVQFTLILLVLNYFYQNKNIPAILFLCLATICRESSIFFLIPIVCISYFDRKEPLLSLFKWFVPILVYVVFVWSWLSDAMLHKTSDNLVDSRFGYLSFNFENIRETSMAVILVSAVPLLLGVIKFNSLQEQKSRIWILAGGLLILFNIIISFTSTIAIEARYYFLPMLFFTPLIKNEILASFDVVKQSFINLNWTKLLLAIVFSLAISLYWYVPHTNGTGVVFKGYSVLYLFIFFIILMSKKDLKYLIIEYYRSN